MNDKKGAYTDMAKAKEIKEKFDNLPADSIPLFYKDSLEFTKLIAFQSDFNNANTEDGYIQYRNVFIEQESNFVITMLAKDEEIYVEQKRKQYFVKEISEYNQSNLAEHKLAFGAYKEVKQLSAQKSAEILKRIEKTLETEPNNPYNYFYIGILNERLGNLDVALINYNKAIELDPTFGFAYLNLANVTYLSVMKKYEREIKTDPNITTGDMDYSEEDMNTSYETPDLKTAIQYYNQALQIFPELGFIYYNRGNLHNKMQNYMAALGDYNKAIKLQPNIAEAYYNKGLTLLLLKNNESACPNLSKAGEMGITSSYNLIKRYCVKE
jgi:tetratricopeptide (TPR) repeat protein